MDMQDFRYLYDYNRWANGRVTDAVSKLSDEQFVRDLKSSHRSVKDTMAHILAAEWIWLERWKGVSPKALLNASEFQSLESLLSRWAEVDRDYLEFIKSLTADSLAKVITYRNTKGEEWSYPLWQMFQHIMNHSTYHRGQLATMLRQMGAEVNPVDLLIYMDVKNR